MDMNLVMECLFYLYPPNEKEDRAFIDRTLPVLRRKLGLEKPRERARRRTKAAAVVALIAMGVLMAGSLVAYAFGFDIIAYFFHGTPEHWTVQLETGEPQEMAAVADLEVSPENYRMWGDAVAQEMANMEMWPELPREFPRGYVLSEVKTERQEQFYDEIKALYENEDGLYIMLDVRCYRCGFSELDYRLQKDDSIQETTMHGDLKIGFAQNYEVASTTWISGNCSVRLYGTCEMNVLRAMIESI